MAEAYSGKPGSRALVHGAGQVEVAGLLWEWNDYSAPAGDPAVLPRFRSRAFGMQGGVRVWHFMTTAEGHAVGVFFRVAYADGTAEAHEQVERRAAAEFADILARLSFRELPGPHTSRNAFRKQRRGLGGQPAARPAVRGSRQLDRCAP